MATQHGIRRLTKIALISTLLSVTSLSAQSALELYQRGLVQERAHGNLREAIQFYEKAAKTAGSDRALAAKALLREAECYRQLGDSKAAELYAALTGGYPEQRGPVAVAEAALAEMPKGSGQQSPMGLSPRMAAELSSVVTPVINNSCISCHTEGRAYGGLSLDNLTKHFVANTPDFEQDAAVWEKVLIRLRARVMPPRRGGLEPLDETTSSAVMATLENALDQPSAATSNGSDLISDDELAQRMASFIWGESPDSTLADLAAHGRLRNPSVIDQQVQRMLASAKSQKLVSAFFSNWLQLNSLSRFFQRPINPGLNEEVKQSILADIARGKALFPERTDELFRAMQRETELFISEQLQHDRPALELWTANYSYLNDQLAPLYGIPNITGSEFRRVTLPGDRRGGLLGQLSVLSATSLDTRTSTVLRGKWVYTTFLGIPLPPPPPNVPPLDQTPAVQSGQPLTLRQRVEAHHVNPSCNSCHMMFEPLGDALGNFDVIGRWRETDAGQPIDSAGTLWDGQRVTGPIEMRNALLKYRDAYFWNVTSALLTQALGRPRFTAPGGQLYPYEQPAVRAILREARAVNYSWSSVIAGIVKSRPFQTRNIVP